MVGSLGFGHEPLVTLDEDRLWVLDFPFADVRKDLSANRSLFGRF